jgi:hypothetical protein
VTVRFNDWKSVTSGARLRCRSVTAGADIAAASDSSSE